MKITLYKFSKRANSLKQPGTGLDVEHVTLKDNVTIEHPRFILNKRHSGYSYMKWDDRYYFIEETTYISNDLMQIDAELDTLATYRGDILNTVAYVNYSTSNYDDRIVDDRFSTVDRATVKTSKTILINDADSVNPTFLINYLTDTPTVGPLGFTWANASECIGLGKQLNSKGYNQFLKEYDKQLKSAYDAILSVKQVPMKWYEQGGAMSTIHLGGYDTAITARHPRFSIIYECSVNIPWQFTDFRNLAPFTSLTIFLPAYGFVDLNPNDFIDRDSINIKLVCDGLTGNGTYIVDKVTRATVTFASEFQLATGTSNVNGVMSGLLNATGNAVLGNYGAAVGGVVGAVISSQQRSYGVVGGIGSAANIKASIDNDWNYVHCMTIAHNTNQDPTSVKDTLGLPVKKVLPLKTLKGFTQCVNASVTTSAPISIKNVINQYLNGGVYIE